VAAVCDGWCGILIQTRPSWSRYAAVGPNQTMQQTPGHDSFLELQAHRRAQRMDWPHGWDVLEPGVGFEAE